MNDDAKEKLKSKVAELIAAKVEVETYEVNVTLSAAREADKECMRRRLQEGEEPGINVDATIDMEEQMAAMEAENEGACIPYRLLLPLRVSRKLRTFPLLPLR